MYKHGIVKVALCSPLVRVGDVRFNIEHIVNAINESSNKGASIIAFPELCISGYNCLDLFYQDYLYEANLMALKDILSLSNDKIIVVNSYVKDGNNLYIASILFNNGVIKGVVPKYTLNKANGSFEEKYFRELVSNKTIKLLDSEVPFGKMIFNDDKDLNLALEVGEDLFSLKAISGENYQNGANLIINSSYIPSFVGNDVESVIKVKSLLSKGGYLLVSTNASETSSEEVPSGLVLGYVGGYKACYLNDLIRVKSNIVYADIDLAKINYQRRESGFENSGNILKVSVSIPESDDYTFEGAIDKSPFLNLTDSEYNLIINTQVRSLINRLNYIGTKKTVIGVSGGLDSTLAILAMAHAYDLMGWDKKDIYALTLPSSNTSDRTYTNANKLMDLLGVSKKEINIHDDVMRELDAIGHDRETKDTTYENVQARFRTYTLMNTANNVGGIVVGTSDMSEVALGWSTFNGDQMAMYGINAALPKTLIREVCRRYKDIYPELSEVIDNVIDTPISPELTGNQLTEDIIGKYEINDFILYNLIRNGYAYEKLEFMISKAFNVSKEVSHKYVTNFNKRFHHQQFKRLTMPEAVRILWFGLSSRTGSHIIGDVYEK